ncbi:MAG TPA: hypothetical protein VHG51_16165 [Longimicrobiaceae bacterium]|nr:hypothetical protein [Longimicrobiaceae bacterium]
MTTVLFATSEEHPALTGDDRIAAEALRERGVGVEPLVWSRPGAAAPDGVRAVVIRSCWDYHLREDAFRAWISALEERGTPLVNPPGLVRWNLHKGYLLELEARGIPVVPTARVRGGDERTLREHLDSAGWEEGVVKPAVSLSAYETWRVRRDDAAGHEARFRRLRERGDVLVQRYLPEIVSGGEWSLVFFGDEFSHAVRKRPKPGDFRVQVEHGGSSRPEDPPRALVHAAARVLEVLPHPPTYARVDGVAVGGRFLLMELECIDPVLFFSAHPAAAARFAERIVSLCCRERG